MGNFYEDTAFILDDIDKPSQPRKAPEMIFPYGTAHSISGFHEPEGTGGICGVDDPLALGYLRIFLTERKE